jgi:hypothetical protein
MSKEHLESLIKSDSISVENFYKILKMQTPQKFAKKRLLKVISELEDDDSTLSERAQFEQLHRQTGKSTFKQLLYCERYLKQPITNMTPMLAVRNYSQAKVARERIEYYLQEISDVLGFNFRTMISERPIQVVVVGTDECLYMIYDLE